jgi:hypothetical protein
MPGYPPQPGSTSPNQIFEAATRGLSKRLKAQERHKTSLYYLFSTLCNLLAILQLMVGATITALGPSSNSHMITITSLGAVNTVVAGVLALMKGRGLPQRHQKDLVEIRKVKTFIKQVAMRLKYGERNQDNSNVVTLIEGAFARYKTMQDVIDINQPDSYLNGPQLERSNLLQRDRGGDEEMGFRHR